MYYLLASKRFKQKRNQILHLMDPDGRTYCQTENVKRKNDARFIEFAEPDGRAICKVCELGKEGDPLEAEYKAIMA